MTVTKADLVNSVLRKIRLKKPKRGRQQYLFPEFDYEPLTKKRAAEIVDTTFEIIKESLEKGEPILVPGFGKFKVRFKWARKGRNPKTGEPIILDSRRVISFQCSPKLKVRIMTAPPEAKEADQGAPFLLYNSDRSKTT
jgi:integration host factor subunit alpha